MKLRLKLFIPLLIVILLSWVLNLFYLDKYSIREPILLKSYSACPIVENTTFELYCITNISDKDDFFTASFPELDSEEFPISTSEQITISNSNYIIKKLEINMDFVWLNTGERLMDTCFDKPIRITSINLINNSKKPITYKLGEFCLYKPNNISNNPVVFDKAMSSSNQSGSYTYKAVNDLEITKMESPFIDIISGLYNININETDINTLSLPLNINQDAYIEIKYSLRDYPSQPLKRFSNSSIPIILRGQDKFGNQCIIESVLHGERYYDITASDVRNMIDEGRR